MSTKLYYFDGRGICEPIRMILSYGGIEFDDIRAPINSFPPTLPPEIKSKCRWGQVPLAEFDGKSLTQSLAVTRYFAKKCNLVPEDLYEAALCDEYVDSVRDMMTPFYAVVLEEDEQKKQEKLQEVLKTVKPRFLDVFESIVKSNDDKHLVGGSVTWADIYLTHALQHFKILLGVDLAEDYPSLKNLLINVLSNPKIQEWVEKRPQTKF